jgi:TatD DNase family protein
MYIDSHAHLTSDKTIDQVDEVIERSRAAGVEKIVNICTDEQSLEAGLALAGRFDWIFNTAATTPHDVATDGELFFPFVENAARNGDLIAIGETGLDYYYEHSDRVLQKQFLVRYFHLALNFKLPLVIHCRDAFSDLFSLSDSEYKNAPAVLHCFTGTLEEARQVLDRNWFLSCSGIVTFKKSKELQEVIRFVPLDRLLVETDAPFLAPQSRRGKMNEPSFIHETVEMIAELKGIEVEEVARQTCENAKIFFLF